MKEVEKYLFDRMVGQINAVSSFTSAVGKNELRKRSAIFSEVDELVGSIKTFLDELKRKASSPSSAGSARALAPIKKPLQDTLTILDSLRTGVQNGELNLTKFRASVKSHLLPTKDKLVKLAQEYFPAGVTAEELKEQIKHVSQTQGHKDALRVLKNAGKHSAKESSTTYSDSNLPEVSAESKKKVQSLMRYKTKLPSSLRGKLFKVIQMPVVPTITSDFHVLTPKFLRRTGMKFDVIDETSFVVLENQILLAFDTIKATEYKGRKTGKDAVGVKGLKARKRSDKHQTMQEEFVLDVVDRINEVSDEDYVLMSSVFRGNPSNGTIAFAWLMPRRIYAMFERNANLAKLSWGLPWSREANSIL